MVIKKQNPKACIISSTGSGSGKTTLSLAVMRLLYDIGFKVRPFKNGPDYLDGTWHRAATGSTSYNLDTWLMEDRELKSVFASSIEGYDIGIIEGAMGLYDGYEGGHKGSTADLSTLLDIPVILIVDCKGKSGSVAPLVYGFINYNPGCSVSGVILNNLGSRKHAEYCAQALKQIDVNVIGAIPYDESIKIPERHLGLVAASYSKDNELISNISEMISGYLCTDSLLAAMKGIDGCKKRSSGRVSARKKCRIGVAYDKAFCFYYQANLDLLQEYGADLIYFSPIDDKSLPDDIDGIYIGGGYPEIFAEELSSNTGILQKIRSFSGMGGRIYAECGGYMYLGKHLEYKDVIRPMCNLFEGEFAMNHGSRKRLGYREIVFDRDTLLGHKGMKIKGHEFHYSYRKDNNGIDTLPFVISPRKGGKARTVGVCTENILASYIHIHFLSCPEAAGYFVESCITFRREKNG